MLGRFQFITATYWDTRLFHFIKCVHPFSLKTCKECYFLLQASRWSVCHGMRSTDNQWSHQRVQDGRFWWILEIIPILLYNWSTYVRTYVYVQDREQRKESAGNLVKVSFPNRYSLPESWSEDPILSNLHKVRKYNIMPYDTGKKTIPFLHTEWGDWGQWSTCDPTCVGGGTKTRSRQCLRRDPAHRAIMANANCLEGDATEEE